TNKTPDQAIVIEMRRRGVSFELAPQEIEGLKKKGAGPKTIAELENHRLSRTEFHYTSRKTLMSNKNYFEAENAFKSATRLNPSNGLYRRWMWNVLFAQETYAEAEKAYRDAIQRDEANAQYYDDLGAVLSKQKDFPAAEAMYRKAKGLKPNDSEYNNHL